MAISHETTMRAWDFLYNKKGEMSHPFEPKKFMQALRLAEKTGINSCILCVPLTRQIERPDFFRLSMWTNRSPSEDPNTPPFVVSLNAGSTSGHDPQYYHAEFTSVAIDSQGRAIPQNYDSAFILGLRYPLLKTQEMSQGSRSFSFGIPPAALAVTRAVMDPGYINREICDLGGLAPRIASVYYGIGDDGECRPHTMIGWNQYHTGMREKDASGFLFTADEMQRFMSYMQMPGSVNIVESADRLLYGPNYETNADLRSGVLIPA